MTERKSEKQYYKLGQLSILDRGTLPQLSDGDDDDDLSMDFLNKSFEADEPATVRDVDLKLNMNALDIQEQLLILDQALERDISQEAAIINDFQSIKAVDVNANITISSSKSDYLVS